jgi:hypothetical protein
MVLLRHLNQSLVLPYCRLVVVEQVAVVMVVAVVLEVCTIFQVLHLVLQLTPLLSVRVEQVYLEIPSEEIVVNLQE